MSAQLMGRAFYADLPPTVKLVLLALADHANDDGTGVFVGQDRLAAKCSCDERTVRRAIKRLVEMGYLEQVKRGRGPGRGHAGEPSQANVYRLVVEALPNTPDRLSGAIGAAENAPDIHDNAPDTGVRLTISRTISSSATTLSGRGNGSTDSPLAAPKRRRERDALFEALFEVATGQPYSPDAKLPRTARSALNAAWRELRDVGATADEVRRAAAAWPQVFPGATCTPHGLAKHWPRLLGAEGQHSYGELDEYGRELRDRFRAEYEREEAAWATP